jgi:flagellar basal-body rod protein FlgF
VDSVAYLGMSAAIQTARAQQISLNNLVNQGTAGFKADFAKISPQFLPTEEVSGRVWAVGDGAGSDLSMGEVRATGRPLDVLLPEGVWMAVQSRSGEEAYTRRADFQIDAAGYLANGAGNRVLDEQGNVMEVANTQKILFSEEGVVSQVPRGSTLETTVVVGRLKLIQPNPSDLYKSEEGLFLLKAEAVLPVTDALGVPPLRVGFLEGSNVNPVLELIELLHLARHHDLNIKFVEAARHQDEVSAALLRLSS